MIRWLMLLSVAIVPACDAPAAQDANPVKSREQQDDIDSSSHKEDKGVFARSGKAIRLCRIKSESVRESSGIAVTDPEWVRFGPITTAATIRNCT